MRFQVWSLFFVFSTVLCHWSSEDLELFHLQQDLVKDYGSDTTFYSFFELEDGPKATHKQITRQFKKLTQKYHPDKAKKNGLTKKAANKRFERLNLINNILKTDKRKRYDYFLDKGFPKYTTAGWIYAKFKPGLTFTICFLTLLITIAHFVILKIQATQNRKRIEALITEIKTFANNQVAGGQFSATEVRKVRVDSLGKTFVVRIDGVFLCDDENEEILERISADDVQDPTWRDILLIKWFAAGWNKVLGSVYFIDLTPPEVTKEGAINLQQDEEDSKKKTKKKPRGEKMVLPNGKVIYSKKKNA